jgi:hypothetical protein
VYRLNVDGETFVDTWRGGRLERREVYAGPDSELPAVLIVYQPDPALEAPNGRVKLDNRSYGYRIEIETVTLR